jgi:outer membrane protein insertion porin family
VNAEIGLGQSVGDRPYPLFKNFFGGGLGSVRGFEQGSLGPRDPVTGVNVGGTKKLNINTELLVPFPGAGNDRTLRLYGFFDIGNVYGAGDSINFDDMRSSYGVGVSWISPVGPLRLAFARPVKTFDGDRIQTLQFQIGTSF